FGGQLRLNRQAWQRRGRFRLAVAQRAEHLEYLAPGREWPAVGSLVLVHRLHEDDFFVGIVLLAGGWVHLPAALAFLVLLQPAVLAAAPLDGHGNAALTAVLALAAP